MNTVVDSNVNFKHREVLEFEKSRFPNPVAHEKYFPHVFITLSTDNFRTSLLQVCPFVISNRALLYTITIALYKKFYEATAFVQLQHGHLKAMHMSV